MYDMNVLIYGIIYSKSTTMKLTFITGNMNKYNEVKMMLGEGFELEHVNLDLSELQDTSANIAKHKCGIAVLSPIISTAILVEDTSLTFNVMNGLPGPYIKHFCKAIGSDGLAGLVEGKDNGAIASCCLAFCESPGSTIHVFENSIRGRIVAPVGPKTFDWDNIFVPDFVTSDGSANTKTFSEMGNEKHTLSHRALCVKNFVKFIRENNYL